MNWDDFRAFVEMLPRAAVVFDEGQRVAAANTQALARLRCKVDELAELRCGELILARASPAAEGVTASTAPLSRALQSRVKLLRADGNCWTLEGLARRVCIGADSAVLMLVETAATTDSEEHPPPAGLLDFAAERWSIGLFEYHHVARTLYASPRMSEVFGCSPEEMVGLESVYGRVHPEDRVRVEGLLARALDPQGDGRFDVRYRILRADGCTRWIHNRAQTYFGPIDGQEAPVVTRGSVMDVTESEELALELQYNEKRLKQAIKASRVGLYEHRFDHSGEQPYWSSTMRELLGFPADAEADFEWFGSRVHPDDAGHLQASIAHANDPEGDGLVEAEYRWHHPDGRLRWLLVRGTTYFGDVGGQRVPQHSVGGILDITDRKVAEADRRRRTAILEATPDVVGIATTEGQLAYLNQAGRTFLGIGPTEDLSTRTIAFAHPPATAKRILTEGFPAAVRDGSWTSETEFKRHDGTIVPMSQVILAHREQDGSVPYFSTIARDRSRERDLEEQFRQAQKMEAIGRLAGGVAHDFNNLLSVITGFTDMARECLEPGHRAERDLEQVQRAAARAASLTRQLLAFGRKQILQPRVMDVNETIRDTLPMLQRLVDDSIEISMVLPPKATNIKADPNQIQQILLNLVVNARDAMPRGGIVTIESQSVTLDSTRAALKVDLEPGHYAVIAVSDTGHGMDAATRDRIFEPFFTTKRAGEGTGLGLSTVFGIVRQSGGSIWVYSEPGRGTTFKIYFPSTDEAPQSVPAKVASRAPPPGGVVLVVDDDEQLREMAASALIRAGYTVLRAETPSDALSMAEAHPGDIDVLLTDVLMPNMSGRDLAERLLKLRPSTAVLYMSGYTEDSIVHHGVLDPGVSFIAKPLSPARLLRSLREVMGRRAAAARSGEGSRAPSGKPGGAKGRS